jgi:hypothetical protein
MGRYQSGQLGQTVNLLADAFVGSNPALPTYRGNSSVGRAQPFQGWGRGSESRFPLLKADVAQLVERFLGKEEVTGSIPVIGSYLIVKNNNNN